MRANRTLKTITEIKLAKQQAGLLDTQDIAVYNAEQLTAKDQQILDLQEMVVALSEQVSTLTVGGKA